MVAHRCCYWKAAYFLQLTPRPTVAIEAACIAGTCSHVRGARLRHLSPALRSSGGGALSAVPKRTLEDAARCIVAGAGGDWQGEQARSRPGAKAAGGCWCTAELGGA